MARLTGQKGAKASACGGFASHQFYQNDAIGAYLPYPPIRHRIRPSGARLGVFLMNTHAHNHKDFFVPLLKASAGVSFLTLCVAVIVFHYIGEEPTIFAQIAWGVTGAVVGALISLRS